MNARRIALTVAAALVIPGATALAMIPENLVIRPGRGAAGVRLGMTQAKVVALRGTPMRTTTVRTGLGTFVELTYPGMVVRRWTGANGRVVNVDVTSRRIRTWYDVGVGSTIAQVKAGFPKVTCETTPVICMLGKLLPGHVVTTFRFGTRRTVTSVSVGRVID